MKKVFLDGSAGTTGLRIADRLKERKDIELVILSDDLRKDLSARKDAINSSDFVFLCLPDDAAREAVTLVENKDTVIIDTSTAHRTNEAFTYGFPELCGQREKIAASKRIANPGCHASGFIALVAPLTDCGIIKKDALLSCFSITGYSGGGKKMIAEYDVTENVLFKSPRQYGLSQNHKHLPEMAKFAGLDNPPVFSPIVAPFYSGMELTIPVFPRNLGVTKSDLETVYSDFYKTGLIYFSKTPDENGFLSAAALSERDDMEISVLGNDERSILTARFDNLGKGASGSAIQNLNIVMGIDESTGLNIKRR
ncbi:MAG: N-acetyl-gamma-glutamyl-phosphate reductase [Clostridia bacterium]|nr:N-acetyl-gamma-glutamyl-phosphate reductase [Clostridia bacterium]